MTELTDNSNIADPLIGQRLGDYEIQSLIGRGGMGRIYKGFDANLARYAAVKVFDPQAADDAERDEYQQRFLREGRAIARLRHPNIVDVYQFGQYAHVFYMAMVLVEGHDLRSVLRDYAERQQHIPLRMVLRIIGDMAAALDYAHAEGVIHRDIKPSNIMIKADNHAILTDFGLALSVPEGTIGTTFGSVHYIAPEQALNSALAVPQSDFYALGVILYEMLTGQVPFNAETPMNVALQHISDAPPPPRQLNPAISPATEQVILRLLEKEPEDRYPNGEAMMRALEQALGIVDTDEQTRLIADDAVRPVPPVTDTKSTVILPPATPVNDRAASKKRLWLWGLGIVAVISMMAAVLLLGNPQDNAPLLTPVPAVQSDAGTPEIRLLYDDNLLTLLNISPGDVDLTGLSFVQPVVEGADLVFSAQRWARGTAPLSEVPADDCFQVWTTRVTDQQAPDACGVRHKWDQASFPRWFWVSEDPDTVFEVRRGDAVLAVCEVGAGVCEFSLD